MSSFMHDDRDPTPSAPLDPGARLLIAALYQVRLLLGPGAQSPDGRAETEAAALVYALHNEALSALNGDSFDVDQTWARLQSVDARLGTSLCAGLRCTLGIAPTRPVEP